MNPDQTFLMTILVERMGIVTKVRSVMMKIQRQKLKVMLMMIIMTRMRSREAIQLKMTKREMLAMGKNSDKPVSILSKAKKDNVKRKKVPGDKKDGDSSNEDQDEEQKLEPLAVRKAKKKEIDSIGRSFPNVLERNAEKTLSKIATRGVVTFFNTVREHQKDMKTKLKEAGGSIRKQEKVYKNLDKNSFFQMLTGKSVSQSEPSAKKVKIDVKDEENEDADKPSWNILRDDYMLGVKMKDWDKESDEEL